MITQEIYSATMGNIYSFYTTVIQGIVILSATSNLSAVFIKEDAIILIIDNYKWTNVKWTKYIRVVIKKIHKRSINTKEVHFIF